MNDRAWLRWGGALGFALGGFFDGILLHQILQWHHLLGAVRGVDLRAQLLWDGAFHALMYLVAVLALIGLWRARARQGAGRSLLGAILIGFALWHIVDSVLSHWLLGIHRIRQDSAAPLAWDLLWLALFGILPLVAGRWLLRRRAPPAGPPMTALAIAGLVAGTAAAWSLRPPPATPLTTVVFAPGVPPARAVEAILAAEGRIAWTTPDLSVALVTVPASRRLGLYGGGALLVSGVGPIAGCLGSSGR